ncbi:M56 family metallopeptidase [Schlesneria paludicola]|uniref:M56 family metallopeptidase n=1 Tax=Schlesneria paludicola TaxID=360056 RepID=UPI00029B36F4|nr:M56 family metallopeptidase [Schlesneria paludicola]
MTFFVDQSLAISIVLSLMHFCWQAVLIASVVGALAWTMHDPRWRYRTLLAGMFGMVNCPVLNYVMVCRQETDSTTVPRSVVVQPRPSTMTLNATGQQGADRVPATKADAMTLNAVVSPVARPFNLNHYAPFVVDVYLVGVAGMMARVLIGLWGGRQLRRQSTSVLDEGLQEILMRQVERIGVKFVPVLAYCDCVDVPAVVGLLKPAILLPFSMTAGLSLDQLEAVIAHELAHLRRYDHLVNVLQRIVESIFFFHPAVWWLSNRIRLEREHCADDLAIGSSLSPLDYAGSLLRVAELSHSARFRGATFAASLLITGRPSTLRRRVARLLGSQSETMVRLQHPWMVVVTLLVGLVLFLGPREIPCNRSEQAMADEVVSTRMSPAIDDVSSTVDETSFEVRRPIAAEKPQEETAKVRVKPRDKIDEAIDEALGIMTRLQLSMGNGEKSHSPWQLMHWIQGFGSSCLIKTGNVDRPTMTGEEWIASGPEFLGEPVWQLTEAGACAHPFTRPFMFQGHPGQFLAWIGAGGVPIEFPLKAKDRAGKYHEVTVRDVVNDTKRRVNRREEMTWTLWALANYESFDTEWKSNENETWSIERLAEYEAGQRIVGAPEWGCPRLFALATALNKYRQFVQTIDVALPASWQKVHDLLVQETERARLSQVWNGVLCVEKHSKDLNHRMHLAASHLTWLSISVDDKTLDQPWMRQSIQQLCEDYVEHQNDCRDVAVVCHAAYALRQLRERRERLIAVIEAQ